jgi:lysophospholipase L1-like esterase
MQNRGPSLFVAVLFALTLFIPGVTQLGIEMGRGEVPQAFDLFARPPVVSHLRAYEATLESESWLASRLRPWMQYARFVLLNDPGEKAVRGRDGWFFYKPGLEYLTQRIPLGPSAGDPLPAIIDFRDQLAARGIHLVVMPVPNKETIYPGQLSSRASSIPAAISDTTRSLLQRLKSAEVDVVDLFDLFGNSKSRLPGTNTWYLATDSHWSPAGVEAAAREVARRLLEPQRVEQGSTQYTSQPAPIQRVGDVVRMLDAPRIEARVGLERVLCTQVVQAATAGFYKDDPSAQVLVLGDSFLRIYQQDEPGAAGFVAHLAMELRQPVASIISDGGASTLVRQELHRRPAFLRNKRVVIWEFVERDIRFGLEGWQHVPLPNHH